MMCGGFSAGAQLPPGTLFSFSGSAASASIHPSVESCDSDVKPERTKLET